jgi:hypothetical protein
LETDAEGNFYVADNQHSLFKYNSKGVLITNVNIKTYGAISSIDCSNPFEIYIFYRDQNIIVFYDNMLNSRGEIRLNDYYFTNVSCVARSFDNNIWIVDMSEYKLLKINKKGDILLETPYLNNVLTSGLKPFKLWEKDNSVFMADSVNGIHKFDHYANHISTYYFNQYKAICHSSNFFFFEKDNTLFRYHILTREPEKLKITLVDKALFTVDNNTFYIYVNNKIISYPADL